MHGKNLEFKALGKVKPKPKNPNGINRFQDYGFDPYKNSATNIYK